MSFPTSMHAQGREQLSTLTHRMEVYDGLTADLRDDELTVTGPAGREIVTCAPRSSDADRLWFWASGNQPIAEADRIIDAAVRIAGRVQAS